MTRSGNLHEVVAARSRKIRSMDELVEIERVHYSKVPERNRCNRPLVVGMRQASKIEKMVRQNRSYLEQ